MESDSSARAALSTINPGVVVVTDLWPTHVDLQEMLELRTRYGILLLSEATEIFQHTVSQMKDTEDSDLLSEKFKIIEGKWQAAASFLNNCVSEVWKVDVNARTVESWSGTWSRTIEKASSATTTYAEVSTSQWDRIRSTLQIQGARLSKGLLLSHLHKGRDALGPIDTKRRSCEENEMVETIDKLKSSTTTTKDALVSLWVEYKVLVRKKETEDLKQRWATAVEEFVRGFDQPQTPHVFGAAIDEAGKTEQGPVEVEKQPAADGMNLKGVMVGLAVQSQMAWTYQAMAAHATAALVQAYVGEARFGNAGIEHIILKPQGKGVKLMSEFLGNATDVMKLPLLGKFVPSALGLAKKGEVFYKAAEVRQCHMM